MSSATDDGHPRFGPGGLYADGLALLTDLYQLTMAQAAWHHGRHRLHSVFHLTMRRCPYGGDFAVAAGIDAALDYAESLRFRPDDLEWLASVPSRGGGSLFDPGFLDHLADWSPGVDVWAVEEGETVLAGSPLLRVEGPLLDAQLLETPTINLVGMPTMVATRAARICHWAARAVGDQPAQPVLEFGLRRAHGVDGGVSVSRAAYLGGCAAVSNVLAGKLHGVPVSGTHAHSWVLSFADEIDAFRAYAEAFPDDTTLLVDTYRTDRGVERAARVGEEMARDGHRLLGVRLDSGDLAQLSREARRILDEASVDERVAVAASGDLDEHRIEEIRRAGARIDLWGVGTRLATATDDSSFSGAYKLSAIEDPDSGAMRPVAKISEDLFKRSLPGHLQVRRTVDAGSGRLQEDVIIDQDPDVGADESGDRGNSGDSGNGDDAHDLLRPALRGGSRCRPAATLEEARERAARCAELLGWSAIDGWLDEGTGPPAHGIDLTVDEAVEERFQRLLEERVGRA